MQRNLIDRIKYDGSSDGWLIYKCPSEQFVLGSQLVVNQSQEALFFIGGKAFDLFSPGTHTLTTGNLPLLNKFVNLPFGGKTPFTAEIYYINKAVKLNMKWGTSAPIPMEDTKYGLILNICARGQYGITIADSRLFIAKIIGTVSSGQITEPKFISKYFNGLINSKIKAIIATFMIQRKISFLDITQYLVDLSGEFQKELSLEFERFGIELINFYCESIQPKTEEYEKFRKLKEEVALGKDFYHQRRSLDILEKFVQNTNSSNVRDDQTMCQKCGAWNSITMKYCGECGNLLGKLKCKFCGFVNISKMKYCGNCGKSIVEYQGDDYEYLKR